MYSSSLPSQFWRCRPQKDALDCLNTLLLEMLRNIHRFGVWQRTKHFMDSAALRRLSYSKGCLAQHLLSPRLWAYVEPQTHIASSVLLRLQRYFPHRWRWARAHQPGWAIQPRTLPVLWKSILRLCARQWQCWPYSGWYPIAPKWFLIPPAAHQRMKTFGSHSWLTLRVFMSEERILVVTVQRPIRCIEASLLTRTQEKNKCDINMHYLNIYIYIYILYYTSSRPSALPQTLHKNAHARAVQPTTIQLWKLIWPDCRIRWTRLIKCKLG